MAIAKTSAHLKLDANKGIKIGINEAKIFLKEIPFSKINLGLSALIMQIVSSIRCWNRRAGS